MNPTPFTKMHGLGNDFIIVNNLSGTLNPETWPIKTLADRYIGIGFDQLLVVEPSTSADFFCRIFNADGSEAEQCGNGLRCVARYLQREKLHSSSEMRIETKAGIFAATLLKDDQVRVAMGVPVLKEKSLTLNLNPESLIVSVLSVGNPHAITKVNTVDQLAVNQLGEEIAATQHFPNGVNVGFMQVVDRSHARLRTFERGVGETNACGSNACAAAVAGMLNGWFDKKVAIEFRYGRLQIEWEGNIQPIYMTGPAVFVFEGEI